MKVTALHTLLAAKVINVTPGLRPRDRQVGLALIEHFNRKTGQCDPGIERIASVLGCCTRTVIRATNRLEELGLILKVRHGGYSNRNSYRPNWSRFAEQEVAWKAKLRSRRTKVSPESGQESHPQDDSRVTQTCSKNLSKQTYVGLPRSEKRALGDRRARSPSSADAARVQAERRWSDGLLRRYASQPVTYAEIIELIDTELSSAATEAELSRHGAGLRVIQQRLKLPVG